MSEQWGLLNGHFTGHLLSALAFDAAGTGSKVTAAKSDTLITELAKCQAAYAKDPKKIGCAMGTDGGSVHAD